VAGDRKLFIAIEGAWERLHPEVLNAYPDAEVRNKVAENLLKHGEMTGEEYLAVTEGADKWVIQGIEDPAVYQANLATRRGLSESKKWILPKLSRIESRLLRIQTKLLTPDLLEIDHIARGYSEGTVDLKSYVSYLKKNSGDEWLHYPNVKTFAQVMAFEDMIDMSALEIESKNLLRTLSEKLDRGSLSQLASLSMRYRLGDMLIMSSNAITCANVLTLG
jgi:hypothetical protein